MANDVRNQTQQNPFNTNVLAPQAGVVQQPNLNQPQQAQNVQNASLTAPQGGLPTVPQQQGKPASSGMFTNLKSYMNANQAGGNKLAGAMGGNVDKNIANIGKQVKAQQDMYSNQINLQTQGAQQAQQVAQNAAQNVMQTGKTDQAKTYQDFASGQQQFNVNQLNLANQAQAAQQQMGDVSKLNNFEGRRQALQDMFAKNNAYGMGARNLDSLILQGSAPKLQGIVEGAQGRLKGQLGDMVSSAGQANQQLDTFNKNIAGLRTGAQDYAKNLNTQFGEEVTGKVNEMVAGRSQEQKNLNKAYMDMVAQQKLDDEAARKLVGENLMKTGFGVGYNSYGATGIVNPMDAVIAAQDKALSDFGKSFRSQRNAQADYYAGKDINNESVLGLKNDAGVTYGSRRDALNSLLGLEGNLNPDVNSTLAKAPSINLQKLYDTIYKKGK
jgi:hypothetical protein